MIHAAPVEIVHSAPGTTPSDDAFGLAHARGALHVWVIDGATSVSEIPDKMVPGLSDAGWFARALSAELHRTLRQSELTDSALRRALAALQARFLAGAGRALADHDYPVAAMSYLRIAPARRGYEIRSLDFADCFHAATPSGPAAWPPIAALPEPLPPVPLAKTGAVIQAMRQRRSAQVRQLASTAITLDGGSVAKGRRGQSFALPGTEILIGSDGFARLWTEYGLISQARALASTRRLGAARMLLDLRAWERAHLDHGRAPKAADDVTAIRIRLGESPRRGRLRRNGTTLHWRADPFGRTRPERLAAAP